jgi:pimeloyl-ACP methyl ester carboxylesterase
MTGAASPPPLPLAEQLARFRAAHRVIRHLHAGHDWHYRRGGEGAEVVLLLTGVLGAGDFAFQQVASLERHYRVLAPDYPPVSSLHELVDGIVSLLDAEGAPRVHVVAGSFGGMAAQALVRRHPGRVRSLVLSHTGTPEPGSSARRLATLPLALLPGGVLRGLFRKRLRGSFAAADPFWTRYFHETTARLGRADFLSRVRVAMEFAEERYGPRDLDDWPGRILVLDADHDPLFPEARQQAVRSLYPRAEVHTFRGTGHAAAILDPEGYASVILRFLQRAA